MLAFGVKEERGGRYEKPTEKIPNFAGAGWAAHVHEYHGGRALGTSLILRYGRSSCREASQWSCGSSVEDSRRSDDAASFGELGYRGSKSHC